MSQVNKSQMLFERRRRRVRYNLRRQMNNRLRLSVFRSGKHIYAQLIDDSKGATVAAASSLDSEVKTSVKSTSSIEAAKLTGALIAKRAKKADVKEVVFDRGGYLFHGRVKALADSAREAGLAF
ncbi:MAG: 50S ribosomal protein L18 [Rickettsiales bacterium]